MFTFALATVHQCFRALAAAPTKRLLEVQSGNAKPVIAEIRHLLTTSDPNGLYLFISCLSYIDPKLWAGTAPDIPAVLEEWEVERVMKLLESQDGIIRKQVCGIISTGYAMADVAMGDGTNVVAC